MWLNDVKFGHNVQAMKSIPSLVINKRAGRVHLGNNVTFNSYGDQSWYCKCKVWVLDGADLIIGDNVGMNGVLLFASNKIVIGNYVKIGGGTRISDSNHHSLDFMSRRDASTDRICKSAPIVIEDDAFIGANCYIGKGVTIGARSIIAAGSVVVKDVPADCVVGGNPCRVIRLLPKSE